MTTERPYHPALSVLAALAELRNCSGTQFDPGLVDIFCADVDGLLAAQHGARASA
jgi:HD-GYP domain-containing protein (c-di-GMP phosphodiesterase class II)